MGIETVRSLIEAEARARIEEIEREADASVAAMQRQAEQDSTRRREAILAEEERRLRADSRQGSRAATREVLRRVLEARNELLERIFGAANEALPTLLAKPDAARWLTDRVRAALRFLPKDPVVVRCSESVHPLIEDALADHPHARVVLDAALAHGFVAENAEGTLVVDGTLVRMLELGRPWLSIEVLRRLDGAETPA